MSAMNQVMNNVMKNVMNRQMMKTMLWATMLALGALCMTGCSNDDDTDAATVPGTSEPRQVTMTMQASTAEPQTRAHYTPGSEATGDADVMHFSWDVSDEMMVYIFNKEGNTPVGNYTLTSTETAKSASFTGSVKAFTGTRKIYAYYPNLTSSGYNANTTENTVDLKLNNPQEFTVGSNGGGRIANSYLVGVGTATATGEGTNAAITASASMKQVMSFVRLNITNAPAKLTGVTLKSADGTDIFLTKERVSLYTAEITPSEQWPITTKVSELTLKVVDETANNTAMKTVSFVLFPDDLSAKKIDIEITFADGSVKTISAKQGRDFQRNIHYDLDVDASDATPVITNKALITAIETAASVSFDKNDGNVALTAANKAKIATITTLNISGKSLTSLDGIEYFTELTSLICNTNKLTALDVSALENLTELNCYGNKLTALNVSGLKNLTKLQCYSVQLTTLDVSGLKNLTLLQCHNNQLTTLDVSELENLTSLVCNGNRLTTLDVSLLTKLELKTNNFVCGSQTSDGSTNQNITVTVSQTQNDNKDANWLNSFLNTRVTLAVAK